TEGEPLLARAQELLAGVVDPGSAPLIEVELLRARCLLDLGRKSEANVLAQQTRRELVSLGSSEGPLSILLGDVLARAISPSPCRKGLRHAIRHRLASTTMSAGPSVGVGSRRGGREQQSGDAQESIPRRRDRAAASSTNAGPSSFGRCAGRPLLQI